MSSTWEKFIHSNEKRYLCQDEVFSKSIERRRKEMGIIFLDNPYYQQQGSRAIVRDPITKKPREVIMMGSTSYLGLSTNQRVVKAFNQAAEKYGYGTGSVSLFTGTTDLHTNLEEKIANFYQCEDAILFPTGYAANVGVLSSLLTKDNIVINDIFNHASIFDGCALSSARNITFLHNRMYHLEKILKRSDVLNQRPLIVVDGVFSMEGDIAKLDENRCFGIKIWG